MVSIEPITSNLAEPELGQQHRDFFYNSRTTQLKWIDEQLNDVGVQVRRPVSKRESPCGDKPEKATPGAI